MSKVALITGAARRIGAACARLLHQQGYNLILHYRTALRESRQLAEDLNAIRPDSVCLIKADLLELDQVNTLAEQALAFWGELDVLVNNASLFYAGKIGDVTEQDWNDLLGSNLKAPFFLSQALAPALVRRGGCIVNIADIHAERGLQGFPVYSIAKAGVVAMTKCLAKELAPKVRVNAVAPGAILWPDHQLSDERKVEILQKVALQRCGHADDIARAVRFLVEEADYITGHILTVDGGRMLFS
ncbi:pteridine reductase [Methylomonas sp. LL1]|uniref:pteridine reductase n=1 Tax=Methylomonas sp. LL1 TaxID=2785785 RepID=UPI0018C4240B|nr:pteridine reductase [Methylomonas sp. LL1]QPK63103.1 pteridine reductase [Methylomonas sp. LL1]CAG1021166.1 3-oxoacyl-[acyl-carrier protein] reductase [Methylococcales bacterium]